MNKTMNEFIDDIDTEKLEHKKLLSHSLPHTEKCCGVVAKIPFYEAYKLWIESKIKVGLFKNKNIFNL